MKVKKFRRMNVPIHWKYGVGTLPLYSWYEPKASTSAASSRYLTYERASRRERWLSLRRSVPLLLIYPIRMKK